MRTETCRRHTVDDIKEVRGKKEVTPAVQQEISIQLFGACGIYEDDNMMSVILKLS
jgi:hypothetical protein